MSNATPFSAHQAASIAGRVAVAAPAVVALLAGVFLLWAAGFAGSNLLHEVAHDTRHGLSFPCH
jgi:cobalt transporter subunit CbtB